VTESERHTDPQGQQNFTFPDQHCGGHRDAAGRPISYIDIDTQQPVGGTPKGFICPLGQLCLVRGQASQAGPPSTTAQEGANPSNGTVNFDNVVASALMVIVITSGAAAYCALSCAY
jgi:hypothetical protein